MGSPTPRFLPLADVAAILNISMAQVYALVRRGDLPAIQIGGRGLWRVETTELEAFIARAYTSARQQSEKVSADDPADEDSVEVGADDLTTD